MNDFWQIFRFVIAALLTLAGVFCMISSVLGLYRFRYALTRIHAASLMDTVSIFLMLSGLVRRGRFFRGDGKDGRRDSVFVDYQPRRVAPDWAAGSDHQR